MSEIRKRIGNVKSMEPERKYAEVKSPSASQDLQRQYHFRRNTADYTERMLKYA